LAVLAPALFLVAAGFLLFPSAGHDDTHISYWPAHTLADSGRILNYNGERVEQSSSLLHVLLLAFLVKVTGADVVTVGRVAGIAAGAATLIVLFLFVQGLAGRAAAHFAAWVAATCVYLLYWSFGGMETPFVPLTGLLMVVALARYLRDPASPSLLLPGLAMGACITVRPESPILLGGMVAGAALIYWRAGGERLPAEVDGRAMRGRLLRLGALYGLLLGTLLCFRFWYFGQWAPQPVHAKFGGLSWTSLVQGLAYLSGSTGGLGPASWGLTAALALGAGIVLLAMFRNGDREPALWLALLYSAGSASFVLFSGGDWMEGGRFLVHFFPVSGALLGVALARGKGPLPVLAFLAVVGLNGKGIVDFVGRSSLACPAWSRLAGRCDCDVSAYSWFEQRSRINRRDMPVVQALDRWTGTIVGRRPGPVVILSGQMGMVPYYVAERHFGRVRFVDLRGLVERTLTACPDLPGVAHTPFGLSTGYPDYFRLLGPGGPAGGLPRPDIIFDLTPEFSRQVEANGYTIVYIQRGAVTCEGARRERFVGANAFVAVRSDLLDGEEAREPVRLDLSAPPPGML
jgi:hypothetical protein